jgi:cytochrome c553
LARIASAFHQVRDFRRPVWEAAAAAALALALPLVLPAGAANAADPQTCAACHGPAGNSTNPALPSLAGQPAQFLSTALFLYRQRSRKDPQMTPIATNLTNAEINELAEYFSRQKPAAPSHKTSPENAMTGKHLAERYNCVQCHGPALKGLQHIPRLAGQQFEYLRTQLRGFKAQTRADIDGNMTAAAQPLSQKDIEVLADYLAGLDAREAPTR